MRYLPHTRQDIESMLKTIGAPSIDALFSSIPQEDLFTRALNLPEPLAELELRNHLRKISRKNAHGEDWSMFLGAGSYSHYIPSAVSSLISRGEFLTAYTPYQPEVSQGTLQAIFEYQTMMAEILGLDIANASQYDASTACGEAARVSVAVTGRKRVLIGRNVHPEYREVVRAYVKNEGIALEEIPYTSEGTLDRTALKASLRDDAACILAGYPNFFGVVEDLTDVGEMAHAAGALLITITQDPLALGLFKSPGEMGADFAVAEGQSFGNSMSFGGPGLGIFAAKKQHARAMPGRLIGETVDAEGKRGFVLTLATREQHIRRERATSNICTNVSLCALAATITLALWGKRGFSRLAKINYDAAEGLKERLLREFPTGVRFPFSGPTFNEFVVQTRLKPTDVIARLIDEKIVPGAALWRWYPELPDALLMCVTEMNTPEHIDLLVGGLKKIL